MSECADLAEFLCTSPFEEDGSVRPFPVVGLMGAEGGASSTDWGAQAWPEGCEGRIMMDGQSGAFDMGLVSPMDQTEIDELSSAMDSRHVSSASSSQQAPSFMHASQTQSQASFYPQHLHHHQIQSQYSHADADHYPAPYSVLSYTRSVYPPPPSNTSRHHSRNVSGSSTASSFQRRPSPGHEQHQLVQQQHFVDQTQQLPQYHHQQPTRSTSSNRNFSASSARSAGSMDLALSASTSSSSSSRRGHAPRLSASFLPVLQAASRSPSVFSEVSSAVPPTPNSDISSDWPHISGGISPSTLTPAFAYSSLYTSANVPHPSSSKQSSSESSCTTTARQHPYARTSRQTSNSHSAISQSNRSSVPSPLNISSSSAAPSASGNHPFVSIIDPIARLQNPFTHPKSYPWISRGDSKGMTADQKKELCELHALYPETTQDTIGKQYGADRTTVSKWLKDKNRWLNPEQWKSDEARKKAAAAASGSDTTKPLPTGNPKYDALENPLVSWVNGCIESRILVNDTKLRERALELARKIVGNGDPKYASFRASSGWIKTFKARHRYEDAGKSGYKHGRGSSYLPTNNASASTSATSARPRQASHQIYGQRHQQQQSEEEEEEDDDSQESEEEQLPAGTRTRAASGRVMARASVPSSRAEKGVPARMAQIPSVLHQPVVLQPYQLHPSSSTSSRVRQNAGNQRHPRLPSNTSRPPPSAPLSSYHHHSSYQQQQQQYLQQQMPIYHPVPLHIQQQHATSQQSSEHARQHSQQPQQQQQLGLQHSTSSSSPSFEQSPAYPSSFDSEQDITSSTTAQLLSPFNADDNPLPSSASSSHQHFEYPSAPPRPHYPFSTGGSSTSMPSYYHPSSAAPSPAPPGTMNGLEQVLPLSAPGLSYPPQWSTMTTTAAGHWD